VTPGSIVLRSPGEERKRGIINEKKNGPAGQEKGPGRGGGGILGVGKGGVAHEKKGKWDALRNPAGLSCVKLERRKKIRQRGKYRGDFSTKEESV